MGALTYFFLDGLISRRFSTGRGRRGRIGDSGGTALRSAPAVSGELRAAIDGFAAGALLAMLIDSMIPEATRESGRVAGLLPTLGFAVATALSSAS